MPVKLVLCLPMTRRPLRAKRALLQLACALLLFAQHLGLAHAVLHAYKHLPRQQHNAVQGERTQGPHAPKLSKVCAFDALFGQVLGAAPPTPYFSSSRSALAQLVEHVPCAFVRIEFLAPLSRGPPAFL
jgi:hypothetical protein